MLNFVAIRKGINTTPGTSEHVGGTELGKEELYLNIYFRLHICLPTSIYLRHTLLFHGVNISRGLINVVLGEA